MKRKIIVENIRTPISEPDEEILARARRRLKAAGIPFHAPLRLYRRSVDARGRGGITFVSSVLAETDITLDEARAAKLGMRCVTEREIAPTRGTEPLSARPLVVGFGPAGMFAALLLAESGYRPLVIERGDPIEKRTAAVRRFTEKGELDPDSNIQFGAGGAGTFSDGKLTTRINDDRCAYVLRRFAEFGAPEEILWRAKPHIGTDRLREVVSRLEARITALGGEVRYRTTLETLRHTQDGVVAVTNRGEIAAGAVILAPGHSARDTYFSLMDGGYTVEPKPFSVGVRIEHKTQMIDEAMHGKHAGDARLGHAEYTLSKRCGERGVYTFCMCPGGEVVAAASEAGGVVVNGMSEYARGGRNSNAAVAVSVLTGDYGATPAGAIAYQRALEQAAFRAGGGDYAAPCQTVGSFFGRGANKITEVEPTYRGGRVCMTDLHAILPPVIASMIGEGLTDFGRKIRGFDADFAVLTGLETRTSAPVRILRGADYTAVGHARVYPCGEGAGSGGGITSAAVDGLRSAEALIGRYAPTADA